MSKSRFFKNTIQSISLLIVTVIVILVVIPGIKKYREGLYQRGSEFIENIEKENDISISYKSIHPFFSNIIIEDLEVKTSLGKTAIKIQKLELRLNILRLISLNDLSINTMDIIENISVIDSNIVLDLSDMNFISRLGSGGSEIDTLPFSLKTKGLNLVIVINNSRVVINRCRLNLRGTLSEYRYKIVGQAKYEFPDNSTLSYFSGDITGRGRSNSGFSNIFTELHLENIRSDLGDISDQKLTFTMEDMVLKFISSRDIYNYFFKIEPLRSQLYLSLNGNELKMSDFIKFKGEFSQLNSYSSLKLDGELKALYNFKDIDLLYSYTGEISGYLTGFNNFLSVSIDTIGNLNQINFKYLNLYTPIGRGSFSGYYNIDRGLPRGVLSIEDFILRDDIKLRTRLELDILNNNYLSLNFTEVDINNLQLGGIPSLLYIDDEDINLKVYREDEGGLLSISANYDRINRFLSSDFRFRDFNIDGVLNLFQLEDLQDSINPSSLSFSGKIESDFTNYNVDIRNLKINNRDNLEILESDFRLKNSSLFIDHLNFNILGIDFVGRIDGSLGENILLNTDCLINDNKYQFTSSISNSLIEVNSNNGLDLKLTFDDSLYIELITNKFPISYMGYHINPTTDLKAVVFDNNDFLLSVKEFSSDISKDGVKTVPNISFILDGNQNSLTMDRIVYRDNISPITGFINLTRESSLFKVKLDLKGSDNEEYSIDSTYSNGTINGDFNVINGKLSRLFIDSLQGKLSSKINLSGNREDFSLKGDINSNNILYDKKEGRGNLKFNINNRYIAINELDIDYHNNSIRIPLLTYNYVDGTLLGSFQGEQRVDTITFLADNSIDFKVQPVETIFNIGNNVFSKMVGRLNISSLKSNDEILFENKVLKVFNNRKALQLFTTDKNLKFTYFYTSGEVITKILKPYFASFEGRGTLKEGKIDLLLTDLNIDASLAEIYVPFNQTGTRRIVEFENLDIKGQVSFTGSINDPAINGLMFAESTLDVDYIDDKIDPIRLNLRLKDSNLTILPANISINGRDGMDLKGSVQFNSWVPGSIVLETSILEKNKIPVHYQYDIVSAKGGIFSNKLNIYWEDFFTVIQGDVVLTDGEFTSTDRIEIIEKNSKKEKIGGVQVDLIAEIGRNNTLYYPNKRTPIVEAVAATGDPIRIKYNSVSEIFSVNGNVTVKEGVVAYSGTPFILREGRVELKLDNENIDPKVHIVGSKSVVNSEDEKIDIILTYSGGLISGLQATWDSSPKLGSENEILVLLGLSTGEETPEIAGFVADAFLTSFVSEPVESALRDVLNIDYVNIDTRFITNITKDSFDQEDESGYNLPELLSDNSISLGDYVTDDLFIKGKIGTKYEDKELGPDFDLSLTLDTPHFQLGFTFTPMLDDTSTYFSPELGIELKWRWVPGE